MPSPHAQSPRAIVPTTPPSLAQAEQSPRSLRDQCFDFFQTKKANGNFSPKNSTRIASESRLTRPLCCFKTSSRPRLYARGRLSHGASSPCGKRQSRLRGSCKRFATKRNDARVSVAELGLLEKTPTRVKVALKESREIEIENFFGPRRRTRGDHIVLFWKNYRDREVFVAPRNRGPCIGLQARCLRYEQARRHFSASPFIMSKIFPADMFCAYCRKPDTISCNGTRA